MKSKKAIITILTVASILCTCSCGMFGGQKLYTEEEFIEEAGSGEYIIEGKTPLEDLEDRFGIVFDEESFDTINGFLISKLNRIPDEDEKEEVVDNGYRFKILEVSQNVVRKVEIKKEPVIEEDIDGKDVETEE